MQDELQKRVDEIEKNYKIKFCDQHKANILESYGRSFYHYGFEFYSVGYGHFPNAIVSETNSVRRYDGLTDYVVIANDCLGGIFLLKEGEGTEVYFMFNAQVQTYSKSYERFYEGFVKLGAWFDQNRADEDKDEEKFAATLDENYRQVMMYSNLEIDRLEFLEL